MKAAGAAASKGWGGCGVWSMVGSWPVPALLCQGLGLHPL